MGFHLKLHHSKAKDRRKQTPSRTSTPLATTTTNIPTPTPIALTTPIRRSATARLPNSPSPRPLTEPCTPPPRYAILNPDDRLPQHPQPRNGLPTRQPIRRSSANPLPASSQREAHREPPPLRRYQSTTALRPAPPPPYQSHHPSTQRLAPTSRDPQMEPYEMRRRGTPMSLRESIQQQHQPAPSFGTPDENARRLDRVREEQARLRRRQSMPMPVATPVTAEPEGGAWLRCGYCQRRIDEPIPMRTWVERR